MKHERVLYGRDAEWKTLEDLLGGARQGGRAALVRGDPAIRKSALLEGAQNTATKSGMRVLRAAGDTPTLCRPPSAPPAVSRPPDSAPNAAAWHARGRIRASGGPGYRLALHRPGDARPARRSRHEATCGPPGRGRPLARCAYERSAGIRGSTHQLGSGCHAHHDARGHGHHLRLDRPGGDPPGTTGPGRFRRPIRPGVPAVGARRARPDARDGQRVPGVVVDHARGGRDEADWAK